MADNYSNLYNPYGNSLVPALQAQQSFTRQVLPQPIGNAYNLATAAEIYNIPAGNNTSVGICLNESVVYLKSYQNGNPVIVGYRLTPLESTMAQTQTTTAADHQNDSTELNSNIKELIKKLDSLDFSNKPAQKETVQWQI